MRNLPGAASLRPLEVHVLDKMGNAVFPPGFITTADINPDADSHRPDIRHSFADNSQAVIEYRTLEER